MTQTSVEDLKLRLHDDATKFDQLKVHL